MHYFLLNVDYAECDSGGIPVLSTAPLYARPVAALALAMAISPAYYFRLVDT